MKKIFLSMLTFCLVIYPFNNIDALASSKKDSDAYETSMKQDLLCLMLAYPEYAIDVLKTDSDKVYLVMKSGRKILYDDGKSKDFQQKLMNTDLQDMMEQIYPLETSLVLMPENFDPGRFRVYPLLSEVYGHSKQETSHNLKNVNIGYTKLQFNGNNNAAASLQSVMSELVPLASGNHNVSAALFPSSGTFNYRVISGTGQLSPHAFGIAIDLSRNSHDYWQWATREQGDQRLKSYPKEVVSTFEKNNFVWGGKWSHFDTLHFEYRPEIILKARYFSDKNNDSENWYESIPLENNSVRNCIKKINTALESKNSYKSLPDYTDKDEIKASINEIFKNRNNAIISSDPEFIKSIYDRKTLYGTWAYEYEIKKMKYLHNWESKQGITFTDIIPTIIINKINGSGSRYSVNLTCSTEYRYIYDGDENSINKFRIGTYHVLQLEKKDDIWVITKEWYKDPFGDSLNLDNIKADSIKEYIFSQTSRDLNNISERRLNAVKYSDQYCGAANEEQYNFKYNKKYRNYNSMGGDCANFASQILYEGGKFKKNSTWNYDGKGATRSWLNADGFKNYMLNSGRAALIAYGNYEKVYKSSYKLLPGDFVAYEKKGDVIHISTVTGADSRGYSLVSCHNADRNKVPWDLGWSNKDIRFWLVHVNY